MIESGIIFLSKKITAFETENIIDLIPKEELSKIKEKDEHPFFQMYSVAHEGTFTPQMIDDESGTPKPIEITWTRKAIESIKNIVLKGVSLFKGHDGLVNKDKNRESIGEIVHDFQKDINGKLHHVIIAYHPPEKRDEAKKFDVCSQEAIWNLAKNAGRLFAETIKSFTGIACQNSNEKKPAFHEAKRLGFIQAFEDDLKSGAKTMNYSEIISEITRSGLDRTQFLKSFVKDFGLRPRHVFTKDDLKDDHDFKSVFEELDTSKKTIEDYKKSLEEKDKKIKEHERLFQVNTAKTRLEKIVKDLPLTENQLKFVTKQFNENINDLSDDGLKKFVESNVNIYKEVMSITNPDFKESPIFKSNDESSNSKDFTKKENNPFLDEDLK